MNWKEQLASSRNNVTDVPFERAKVYDSEKEVSLPVISREDQKPFEQVRPQPVISPGIYEAEFMTKGGDVIFHFWPYGYHNAEELDKIPPRFQRSFPGLMKEAMTKALSPTVLEIQEDRDMGAWFVRAKSLADKPFARDLAVKAMEAVHKIMGGTEG